MRIYTGQCTGKKLQKLERLDLGIMISTSPHRWPSANFKQVPCALDNGAFACWAKGYPFQAEVFRETIRRAYKESIPLDFIVCPDVVCGGSTSLKYSLEWAAGELKTAPRLALAVQDGMRPDTVREKIRGTQFTHLFIGGSVEWKWETAGQWIEMARGAGLKSHIGRYGKLGQLIRAHGMGADSVDSTSWARNDSWQIIEEFYEHINGTQKSLLEAC